MLLQLFKVSSILLLCLPVLANNEIYITQVGTSNNFTLDITQDGSGDHNGTLILSGNPTTITLTQDSSTDQNYHLSQVCATSTCSATVTQN